MDVWECALGFMDAQVLMTATELRVFDELDPEPRTPSELARRTGLPEPSTHRLLTMLAALELVERDGDGRYRNSSAAAAQLVSHSPEYIGHMFRHIREELYPVWQHVGTALREQEPQWARAFPDREAPTAAMYSDAAALRSFMNGMHPITYHAARQFAGMAPELGTVGNVIDVGGASGAFLIALAQQHAHLRGSVFDLPPVGPIALDRIREAGLQDRLGFIPGDFWKDPLPERADAYSLGFILHDWHDDGCDHLLDAVATAAGEHALMIIGEYVLNETRTGPLHVARQDLNMLVAARGRERTIAEYGTLLKRHGFRLERAQPTSHGKNFLIARRVGARVRTAAHAPGV